MRYILRGAAIVSALLVLGASAASAQHPQTRKGFWIGFGFGWRSTASPAPGAADSVVKAPTQAT